MHEVKPNISIVISTFNRGAMLSRCVDSLFNQSYPENQYEIIVINAGSTDNTENILRESEKKAECGFLWISLKNEPLCYTRNFGIAKSRGDLICFTDDDCIADYDWINNLVNGFVDDTIGGVGGKVVSYKTDTPIQQYSDEVGILAQERFVKLNTLLGANIAYRKKVLTDIKGFDDYLTSCDDMDVSIKTQLLGYKLRYTPEAIVYHDHRATVEGLYFQQYRNGRGYVQLHRKYRKKYNLALIVSISGYEILLQVLFFPFTLVSALLTKKKKYYVLKPCFSIIDISAFSLGLIHETLFGEEYKGEPFKSQIDFFEFMDEITISSLWQKIIKKVRKN
jgi:cellulose synthase/poly-beta-1,6-N-acetylglucosamine synthase-like glycosyltransferase